MRAAGGYFGRSRRVRPRSISRVRRGRAQSYADMFHALACVVLAYNPVDFRPQIFAPHR